MKWNYLFDWIPLFIRRFEQKDTVWNMKLSYRNEDQQRVLFVTDLGYGVHLDSREIV